MSEFSCPSCGRLTPVNAVKCPFDGTALSSPKTHISNKIADLDGREQQAPSGPDPLVGTLLGEYRLEERIGAGGMGYVYRGVHAQIGKKVAIKILRPDIARDPNQVQRLLSEARAVSSIRHRGIIEVFGFGQRDDGSHFMVMEYLEGAGLDARLRERGCVPVREVLQIMEEVLSALGAAHRAGVIHRDLKPSNIFEVVDPDGGRFHKLLDFGLAKQGAKGAGLTAQTHLNVVSGTPEYMSPEQATSAPVSAQTDLYALGVVAFEMLTCGLPFSAPSPVGLLMAHLQQAPPAPSSRVASIPAEIDQLVLWLLQKEPAARPSSADAVRARVRELLESDLSAPTLAPVAAPRPGKRTVLWTVPLLVVAAGLAGFFFLGSGQVEPKPPPLLKPPPPIAVPAPVEPMVAPVALTPALPAAAPPPGPVAPPKPASTRRPPRESGPSQQALLSRIAALETALKKRVAAGQKQDRLAMTFLSTYRVQALQAADGAARRAVAKNLDSWEKQFLEVE